MGFFDFLQGSPSAETPKPVTPPLRTTLSVAPVGGAMMVGCDADGNTVSLYVSEGTVLPLIGTENRDSLGNLLNYFGSNGWNPGPVNPALLTMQPVLVPLPTDTL